MVLKKKKMALRKQGQKFGLLPKISNNNIKSDKTLLQHYHNLSWKILAEILIRREYFQQKKIHNMTLTSLVFSDN